MRKNGRRGTYAICGRRVGNGETQTASTVAGIASRVLLHPIDSIKTRMQTARGRGMEMTVWKTIRGGGIRGLYRGIVGSIIGVVPYSLRT